MAGYLVDTNILILAFRKRPTAVHLLRELKETLFVSLRAGHYEYNK